MRHFRDDMSDEFDSWQPNAAEEAWEAAWQALDEKPDDPSQFNPERIENAFLVDTIKLFIGYTLADSFEEHFGKKPAPSRNKFGRPAGPFFRFARFILKEAGVELADETIIDYLAQAQKAERQTGKGKAVKK